MGEGLPAMLARCDQVFADEARERLTRTVSGTITDQVWATTSGFFSLPPLAALLMTFGADRVLFSRWTTRSAPTGQGPTSFARCRSQR